MLAATDEGLSYVGTKESQNEVSIFSFYPNKMLVRNKQKIAPYAKQLQEYFAGCRKKFTVPLDISNFGSAFQHSVLNLVKEIPYGATVSYGDITAALDNSRSVRAVAHAIALNPVLVFIPCHRVILSTGKPGGYRLSTTEKMCLLSLERNNLEGTKPDAIA